MKRDLFPKPLLAEAIAALQAVLFFHDWGFRNIILEGDSSQVVQGLKSSEENGTSIGMILVDARSLLANFDAWAGQHGRNNNKTAHALGKDAWV